MKTLFSFLSACLILTACGEGETLRRDDSTITDVMEIVNTDNRDSLIGRAVRINRATATQVVGDYVFWAGNSGRDVPVLLEGEYRGTSGETDLQIRLGRAYEIVGIIRSAEQVRLDEPQWRLIDEHEARDIEDFGVFIQADVVSNAQ